MKIKRIISIFSRDFSNSIRDKLLLYVMVAPVILALILNLFVPGFQSMSLEFAVSEDVSHSITEKLQAYGKVNIFKDADLVKNRVREYDDVVGIISDSSGDPIIVCQGNEALEVVELTELALKEIISPKPLPAKFEESDLGNSVPFVVVFSLVFIIMISFLVGGLIIGFNIIEEKESNTLKALNVTPMTRGDFIAGRSLIGLIMPIIHAFLAVWIFRIPNINYVMLLVITLISSLTGLVFGFLIGAISKNQMSGIANMKIFMIIIVFPLFLTLLLPASKQFFLYWAPTYWSFVALKDLILQNQTWSKLSVQITWMLLTTLAFFLALNKKIKQGLTVY